MLAITDYPAFVVAILLFLAIPGPGNLAIISGTAQGGVRGGLASTLGIIGGDQILMWCAVAGVAALLKAYPTAFHLVQWLGAAYLAYLGVRLLLAKPGIATLRDYEEQKKMGLDPVFVPARCGIKDAEIWDGIAANTYPQQLAALHEKTKTAHPGLTRLEEETENA